MTGTCHFSKTTGFGTTVLGSAYVGTGSGTEAQLQTAVGTIGPISVCINANENFMGYSGG